MPPGYLLLDPEPLEPAPLLPAPLEPLLPAPVPLPLGLGVLPLPDDELLLGELLVPPLDDAPPPLDDAPLLDAPDLLK